MNSTMRMTSIWAALLLAVFPAFSDTVFLKSGEVVLGNLISASSGNVVMRSLGKERIIEASKIAKSEEGLGSLQTLPLEIYLKDGTVMRGMIVDYDEEIGVFIDISFGNIALPVGTIEIIRDPRVAKAIGDDRIVGLSGRVGLPLAESFGISGGMTASVDFKSSMLHRLYIGADISWNPLNYTSMDQIEYMLAGLTIHALYRFSGLGEDSRFFSTFVPYAKLGGGAVLVQVIDSRTDASAPRQGGLTGMVTGQIGLEWKLPSRFWLRGSINTDLVFQSGGLFFLPGAGLGLYIGL